MSGIILTRRQATWLNSLANPLYFRSSESDSAVRDLASPRHRSSFPTFWVKAGLREVDVGLFAGISNTANTLVMFINGHESAYGDISRSLTQNSRRIVNLWETYRAGGLYKMFRDSPPSGTIKKQIDNYHGR